MALKCKHKSTWITPNLGYKHALITVLIVINFSKKVTLYSLLKVCIQSLLYASMSVGRILPGRRICEMFPFSFIILQKNQLALKKSCQPHNMTTLDSAKITEWDRWQWFFLFKDIQDHLNILWILGHLISSCKYEIMDDFVLTFLRRSLRSPK